MRRLESPDRDHLATGDEAGEAEAGEHHRPGRRLGDAERDGEQAERCDHASDDYDGVKSESGVDQVILAECFAPQRCDGDRTVNRRAARSQG